MWHHLKKLYKYNRLLKARSIHLWVFNKDISCLAGFQLFFFFFAVWQKEAAERFSLPHCGGKMHHFMTCYKKNCAFHCKLCNRGKKKKVWEQTKHQEQISKAMPLHKRASLVSTVEHCKGLLHCGWPNTHTHTHTHTRGTRIAPIRAQTLLRKKHLKTRTHTHMKKKTKKTNPKKKKKNWRSPSCVFCDASNCQWPWRDLHPLCRHTDGGGVKVRWTCVCVCVRVSFQRRVVTMKWSRNRIAALHSTWPQQWWA